MKLAPKDAGRLVALRQRAEDPGRWNWDPLRVSSAIGEERFQQIVKEAKEGPGGTRNLQFTREEVRKILSETNAPQDAHLSHGVYVQFDVSGFRPPGLEAVATLTRHASFSRTDAATGRRERLPERYVRQAIAKLGFTPGANVTQNTGSGVWHAFEPYELPVTDAVGTVFFPTKADAEASRRPVRSPDALCPIGQAILVKLNGLPKDVKAAFSGISDLVIDETGGPGCYRMIGGTERGRTFEGWKGHPAAPMILWMEQWVNHTTQCPTCQQQQDGTFSIADEPEN